MFTRSNIRRRNSSSSTNNSLERGAVLPTSTDNPSSSTSKELITRPAIDYKINSTYDVLRYAAKTYGSKSAMGSRKVEDLIEEGQARGIVDCDEEEVLKLVQYPQLSDFQYITFTKLEEEVSLIAHGLDALGICPSDTFSIYASTSANWQSMALACASISITIVPAYHNSNEANLLDLINETECVGIFADSELLPTLLKALPNMLFMKFIIYDGNCDQNLIERLLHVRPFHLQVHSMEELRKIGSENMVKLLKKRRPKSETVACIMYTSGTIGSPKGVILQHSHIVASLGSLHELLGRYLVEDDTYLAYLPLAHIFEFVLQLFMLFSGICVGYGRISTLLDDHVRYCKGDILTFRPSIMAGVPSVWEAIRKTILSKFSKGQSLTNKFKETIFLSVMSAKKKNIFLFGNLADNLLRKGTETVTGGRLRICLNGRGILNKATKEFVTTVLGVQILQSYGLTESCGVGSLCPPKKEFLYGDSDGIISQSVKIKLRDIPVLSSLAETCSTPNHLRGEICICGPSVAMEYINPDSMQDGTIFTDDDNEKLQWFRTGDIGRINEDGTLTVIDRLSNLDQHRSGEIIPRGLLASVYKSCNLVSSVCVTMPTNQEQPIAIIVPDQKHLRMALTNITGVDATRSLVDLCQDEQVMRLILKDCNKEGLKNGFTKARLLQKVILTPIEWTSENGLRTVSQKVDTAKIVEMFKDQI